MKTLVKVFFALVIVTLVAAGFFWLSTRYGTDIVETITKQEETSKAVTIEEKTIADQEKPFNIKISYPHIKGAEGFNSKVKGFIDGELQTFKQISLENDNAVKETDPEGYEKYPREYSLQISYKTGAVGPDLVSTMFSIYNFTGGAHGNAYFVAVNYNIADNKEVALAEFFPGQSDYLKKVSDFCMADLKKQLAERIGNDYTGWIEDGAGPNAENFQAFLVSDNDITFYFAPYQIAAYAAGDFQVTMPRPK